MKHERCVYGRNCPCCALGLHSKRRHRGHGIVMMTLTDRDVDGARTTLESLIGNAAGMVMLTSGQLGLDPGCR